MSDDFDDEMDDAEWDRWMKLTDAQQDAELQSAVNQWNELWASMSEGRRFAARRRMGVASCLRARELIRKVPYMEFFKEMLKDRQKSLAMLRIERAIGIAPGRD